MLTAREEPSGQGGTRCAAWCSRCGLALLPLFVLSLLVSQPPLILGPSTPFSVFVNGYHADDLFQNNVDAHLGTPTAQGTDTSQAKLAKSESCTYRVSHNIILTFFPNSKGLTTHRNNTWCLLFP